MDFRDLRQGEPSAFGQVSQGRHFLLKYRGELANVVGSRAEPGNFSELGARELTGRHVRVASRARELVNDERIKRTSQPLIEQKIHRLLGIAQVSGQR